MYLPQGKIIFENLNTSFTNLEELLAGLKAERHTGYVRVAYWDFDGVVFLDNGRLINAILEESGQRLSGVDAVSGIMEKSVERDGTINVYSLTPDLVILLASAAKNDAVHRDLSTEYTNLGGLIEKLQADKHTGPVEVVFAKDGGGGMIFLQDGYPMDAFLTTNGNSETGVRLIPKIIQRSSHQGATFNVYRADLESSVVEGAEVMVGYELPLLLEVWGEILACVENAAARIPEKSAFRKTFDDVRIRHAEDYPFLDPFAAEFEYQDGRVEVTNASVRQINAGLATVVVELDQVLDHRYPEFNLSVVIGEILTQLKETRQKEIQKFQLDKALPGFFG